MSGYVPRTNRPWDEPKPLPERRVLRHWPNVVSGWCIGYGMFALTAFMDPLAVYTVWDDGGQGFVASGPYLAWFVLLSVGALTYFGRPRTVLDRRAVRLRDPLRDITIAWARVDEFDPNRLALRVRSGERWFSATGSERGLAWAIAEVARRYQAAAEPGDEVTVRWRRPEWPEILLTGFWLLYLGLGAAGVRLA